MPAVFVGHGSPMNAITDNRYGHAWRAMADALPRPRAILAISAHWFTDSVAVTVMDEPRTIHDFGGFPQALYDVEYPAPGSPALAGAVADLLSPLDVGLDTEWGIDHGTWSVLVHAYPAADVPVVQLAIDATKPPRFHFDVGTALAPLRQSGVLILGSGNVVHNLRRVVFDADKPFDWTVRFDEHVQQSLEARDDQALIDYLEHPDGRLAAPTPDHYLPLLYIAGLRHADDDLRVIVEGYEAASLSMRSIQLG
jgi:4,5-DOPA dioxygenase extradiol